MTGPSADRVRDTDERRVLSVGTAGGIVSGFGGLPDGGGLVKLGDDLLSIDEQQYRLWDAGLLAPAREVLLQHATENGMRDPEEVLRELAEDRLVFEHTRDPSAITSYAGDHSATFTGHLAGNGSHRSARFLVGTSATAQLLSVDVVLYEFLLRADGRAPIAEQCARLDTGELPRGFSPLQHVAESLPGLLRVGLISLDRISSTEGKQRRDA